MVAKVCPDDEFIRVFEEYGPLEASRILKIDRASLFRRRRRLEEKLKRAINPPDDKRENLRRFEEHPERITLDVKDGVVLIGSDAHYWPGYISTAHRAFVMFCKKYDPVAVIVNGDEFDGASISRHPPIGWEGVPTVEQEIEFCASQLDEIFKASPNSRHIWPLGNHDARFSTRLATHAPQFARVKGTQLKDHFPGWQPCWSTWINNSVVVKHRFKGGVHATHNNAKDSGLTMVTGHLHSQKVTPWTDYTGTRWGVDSGTMADPFSPQFRYMEDNPRNWRSGFSKLTFRNGRLADPELVRVTGEGEICFRGEFIRL